jgi:hypothetical protein
VESDFVDAPRWKSRSAWAALRRTRHWPPSVGGTSLALSRGPWPAPLAAVLPAPCGRTRPGRFHRRIRRPGCSSSLGPARVWSRGGVVWVRTRPGRWDARARPALGRVSIASDGPGATARRGMAGRDRRIRLCLDADGIRRLGSPPCFNCRTCWVACQRASGPDPACCKPSARPCDAPEA